MSNFTKAMTTKDVRTEKGMPAHSTSGSALVDLFFTMGASRNLSPDRLIGLFGAAFAEDPLLATKAVMYNRDIRGGQGERRSFRIFFRHLAEKYPEIAKKNLHLIPEFGRWDDILVTMGTEVEPTAAGFIFNALKNGDGLCAKWMPREGKADAEHAYTLMEYFDLSPREYRKLLAGNTEVVENLMCENKWDEIDYNHLPSIAVKKYRKAWARHDAERYTQWINDLTSDDPESTAKINAGAIFPHDIVRPFINFGAWGYSGTNKLSAQEEKQLEAQWAALPNYMPEGRRILPICDTSGSMFGYDRLPILVSVALGLYLSERNVGPFKDLWLTFNTTPKAKLTQGSLGEKIRKMATDNDWGGTTNFVAAFDFMLKQAVDANLSPEDMPEVLLIISDMQFDSCVRKPTDSALEAVRRRYEAAGYEVPQVVFWNVRTGTGVPVKFNEQGTAVVSGFSPSIMSRVLSGKSMNPLKVVVDTLNDERYDAVRV